MDRSDRMVWSLSTQASEKLRRTWERKTMRGTSSHQSAWLGALIDAAVLQQFCGSAAFWLIASVKGTTSSEQSFYTDFHGNQELEPHSTYQSSFYHASLSSLTASITEGLLLASACPIDRHQPPFPSDFSHLGPTRPRQDRLGRIRFRCEPNRDRLAFDPT